ENGNRRVDAILKESGKSVDSRTAAGNVDRTDVALVAEAAHGTPDLVEQATTPHAEGIGVNGGRIGGSEDVLRLVGQHVAGRQLLDEMADPKVRVARDGKQPAIDDDDDGLLVADLYEGRPLLEKIGVAMLENVEKRERVHVDGVQGSPGLEDDPLTD